MSSTEQNEPSLRDQILENQSVIDELNAKLARKSEEVKIIQQISSELNATLELDRILQLILASMDSVLGFDRSMILLADSADQEVTLAACRGYVDAPIGARVPFGQGVIGVVAKKRRMMRMGNIQTQLKYQSAVRTRVEAAGQREQLKDVAALPGLADAQSQIAIPLLVQDRLVGVFAVESAKANAFDELDSVLLSIVANQVASAIDNARLHHREVERSKELDKAVQELSQLTETLEAKVDERTSELSSALAQIKREKQLSEDLLNRMAPPEVIPLMREDKLDARKITATIVFTDLENFTEFTAGMEPDEIFSRLNHYFSWSGELIARYRGYVSKRSGDGTMALFGVPGGNATHAIDAVLVALALQRELREHIPLNMRIGINTGVVTTGLLGPKGKGLYDVLGDAVNTASRMETLSPPGGIIVADETYRLIKPYFDIDSLGEKEAKGLRQVSCYQVSGLKPLDRDERRVDPGSRFASEITAILEEVEAFKRQHFGMIDFVSVQARDGALGHNEAVAAYALAHLRQMKADAIPVPGLDALDEAALLRVALLHDIGKHAVDSDRLNERSLGEPTRDALRREILENTLKVLEQVGHTELRPTVEALYDFAAARGADANVDPLTEILAVADVYDALTAPKLYKGAPWRISGALEELLRLPYCHGTERPIFSAFVDMMKPENAVISAASSARVTIR